MEERDGMGVVEVILITVVLIALVIIFKKQISGLVSSILSKMSNQANQVLKSKIKIKTKELNLKLNLIIQILN